MHPMPHDISDPARSRWGAALIGIAIMAGVDEIIFHQVLGWHHFYDLSTSAVGLLSDGLLHSAELIALVAGFFILLDLRRRNTLAAAWAWAGFFMGMGGFQLFDGIVNHKVLSLHQIRYGVNILPYDVAWNLAGLALLVVGFVLLGRARSTAATNLSAD